MPLTETLPSAMALLMASAMQTRPFWSEYRILAMDPTTCAQRTVNQMTPHSCASLWSPRQPDHLTSGPTIWCFPASLIQRMLSWYCCRTPSLTPTAISSRTVAAIWSVTSRSLGSHEVHTQRNGPKPSEKMSLVERGGGGHHVRRGPVRVCQSSVSPSVSVAL